MSRLQANGRKDKGRGEKCTHSQRKSSADPIQAVSAVGPSIRKPLAGQAGWVGQREGGGSNGVSTVQRHKGNPRAPVRTRSPSLWEGESWWGRGREGKDLAVFLGVDSVVRAGRPPL